MANKTENPQATEARMLTLAELLLWNQDQLRQLQEVLPFAEKSLEDLRVNAIEVATESCSRCQHAVNNYGEAYSVKPWMMEVFGSPQQVRLRDTNGTLLGVVNVLEMLGAKEVPTIKVLH